MHRPARKPNELEQLFVERANGGDIEGLLALYEQDATIVSEDGTLSVGKDQIRTFLVQFLADCPRLGPSAQAPAVRNRDLALTSSRLVNGGMTAEVARRQADGNWLWVIDVFSISRAGG